MAVVTLNLPDHVWAKYQEMNPDSPQIAAEKQLVRFADVSTKSRFRIVGAEALKKLEAAFGMTIENPLHLASWVERTKAFDIEGVKISLTDGQMKRLSAEALKSPGGIKEYLPARVKTIFMNAIGF